MNATNSAVLPGYAYQERDSAIAIWLAMLEILFPHAPQSWRERAARIGALAWHLSECGRNGGKDFFAAMLGLPVTTAGRHLERLVDAGLITRRPGKRGRIDTMGWGKTPKLLALYKKVTGRAKSAEWTPSKSPQKPPRPAPRKASQPATATRTRWTPQGKNPQAYKTEDDRARENSQWGVRQAVDLTLSAASSLAEKLGTTLDTIRAAVRQAAKQRGTSLQPIGAGFVAAIARGMAKATASSPGQTDDRRADYARKLREVSLAAMIESRCTATGADFLRVFALVSDDATSGRRDPYAAARDRTLYRAAGGV